MTDINRERLCGTELESTAAGTNPRAQLASKALTWLFSVTAWGDMYYRDLSVIPCESFIVSF